MLQPIRIHSSTEYVLYGEGGYTGTLGDGRNKKLMADKMQERLVSCFRNRYRYRLIAIQRNLDYWVSSLF